MIVLGLDPGTSQSSVAIFDGRVVTDHYSGDNEFVLAQLAAYHSAPRATLVIEKVESMGMSVGQEVFETVFWAGRFAQAWPHVWGRLARRPIKLHLCGTMRATDANIRAALIDRFSNGRGKETAIGTKKQPGPLYGLKGHEYAALAVAVTWWDYEHVPGAKPAPRAESVSTTTEF